MTRLMSISERVRRDYMERARAMREEGWTVTDNDSFESLIVECKEQEICYEFKYNERDHIKADQPDWLEMDFEDYVLALAVNW